MSMRPQLALIDQTFFRCVNKLDRVFHRQNVPLEAAVQIIDHGRQGCRLTGTRRSGDEYQPFVFFTQLLQNRRHAQFFEAHDFCRNGAKDRSLAFALQENVDAEPGDLAELERKIAFVSFFENSSLRVIHDIVDQGMNFLFGKRRVV